MWLTVEAFAVAKCCLEIIVPDKVCLCSNFDLIWKFHRVFASFCWKKKSVLTEIHLLIFKIVDKKYGFNTIFTYNQMAINLHEKSYPRSPTEKQWDENGALKFGLPEIWMSRHTISSNFLWKFALHCKSQTVDWKTSKIITQSAMFLIQELRNRC